MKRKWVHALALAMAVAMSLFAVLGMVLIWPLAGSAAEMVDLGKPCSLKVSHPTQPLAGANNEEFLRDLTEADVVVDVYKVAAAKQEESYDGYTYDELEGAYSRLLDEEAFSGYLKGSSVSDGSKEIDMDKVDDEFWRKLVQAAAKLTLLGADDGTGAMQPVAGLSPVSTIAVRGVVQGDASGTAADEPEGGDAAAEPLEAASGLESGLYLLIPRGKGLTDYITTAADGGVATVAYSTVHGYAFEPMMISLPTKNAYTYGEGDIGFGTVINTGNPGDWIYDAVIDLKPARMNGSLEIVKTLPVYEDGSPAIFVFRVTLVLPTGETRDRVEALSFAEAGQESVLIEDLPAGTTVTVEEIYEGSSYRQKGDAKVTFRRTDGEPSMETYTDTITIGAARTVRVEFENEYDFRRKGGYGIINSFTAVYDETRNEWTWEWEPGPRNGTPVREEE